jgi:hypothetical protein
MATHQCSGVPIPTMDSGKRLKSYAVNVYPVEQKPMNGDPAARMIPLEDRKRWDFALSNFLLYAPSNKPDRERLLDVAVGDITVMGFAGLPAQARVAYIDRLWAAIVEWVLPTDSAQDMFDPKPGDQVHNVSSTTQEKAFAKFGIGFRAEKDTDKERILKSGFEPLYALPSISASLGHEVAGTVMQRKTALGQLGLWKENKDAIGQTGICVARGAMGATKFPEASYTGDVYLFAVQPKGRGYDTEKYQANKSPTAVWKPGEKLFPKVLPSEVLAYMKVTKMGTDEYTTVWKIQADTATSTILGGSEEEKRYIESEFGKLKTPGGRRFLAVKTSEYDFHQAAF